MKKIIFFLIPVLFISCTNDDNEFVSNELKKRVVLLERHDPSVGSYIADSIIESYKNKMIIGQEHYFKLNIDSTYKSRFETYEYNTKDYLIKISHYNDVNLNENYAITNFNYENGNIKSRIYNRFSPSNFSNTLVHSTTHFEYDIDTINKYDIIHSNNDALESSEEFIVYGSLDSIRKNNRRMYVFNNLNDINETYCWGSDCDNDADSQLTYRNEREPLIKNIFGNELNMFLIRSPFKHYYIETSKKWMTRAQSFFPRIERNGRVVNYIYSFDENNRLVEFYTSEISSTKDIIRYYYE